MCFQYDIELTRIPEENTDLQHWLFFWELNKSLAGLGSVQNVHWDIWPMTHYIMHVCCMLSCLSRVQPCTILWTVAHQALLSSKRDSPARILEWLAMPSSRGSSQLRNWTSISYVSCIGTQVLYHYHHPGNLQRYQFSPNGLMQSQCRLHETTIKIYVDTCEKC